MNVCLYNPQNKGTLYLLQQEVLDENGYYPLIAAGTIQLSSFNFLLVALVVILMHFDLENLAFSVIVRYPWATFHCHFSGMCIWHCRKEVRAHRI